MDTTLIDLHTHSHHSDGTLPPAEVVAMAVARGIAVLALTDHDTTAGLEEAREAAGSALQLVSGVEISAGWRGQEIHVVGLGIDEGEPALQRHLAELVRLRRERIAAIGARLARQRHFAGRDPAEEVLAAPHQVPTRTHLARALVAAGDANSTQQAFDRWLGRGTPGHVPQEWPALEAAIAAIRGAGGHAVLAHPHRYRLSSGALRNLCAEFRDAGGVAMEVSLPALSPDDANRLARLARAYGLLGSAASDFHEPGLPWRPLGRFAKLPEGIEPLLPRL
ncbi:MAG: PHP domain-containing protein, partial [Pseudomonadota bacterium]